MGEAADALLAHGPGRNILIDPTCEGPTGMVDHDAIRSCELGDRQRFFSYFNEVTGIAQCVEDRWIDVAIGKQDLTLAVNAGS